jgi:uncharacterized protein YndB with AHSA1/START domain
MTMQGMRTRTFTLYAAATRGQVWTALTDPECTRSFYLGLAVDAEWREDGPIAYGVPGGGPDWAELRGHIVHVEPGHRLVHSLDEATVWGEAPGTWVSWAIDEMSPGLCRITLTADDLDGDDADDRDDAWSRVLSGLKTVLETGRALRH